jgi:hypothetical protein
MEPSPSPLPSEVGIVRVSLSAKEVALVFVARNLPPFWVLLLEVE